MGIDLAEVVKSNYDAKSEPQYHDQRRQTKQAAEVLKQETVAEASEKSQSKPDWIVLKN